MIQKPQSQKSGRSKRQFAPSVEIGDVVNILQKDNFRD